MRPGVWHIIKNLVELYKYLFLIVTSLHVGGQEDKMGAQGHRAPNVREVSLSDSQTSILISLET